MSALRASPLQAGHSWSRWGATRGGQSGAVPHWRAGGLGRGVRCAVRRAGVVRVNTIPQLFAAGKALSTHIKPTGNRLAIVTNGGGPGVMATDLAVDLGVRMAELSVRPSRHSTGVAAQLVARQPAGHHRRRHRRAVSRCGRRLPRRRQRRRRAGDADAAGDDRPTEAAQAVIEVAKTSSKPVLTCWMGEAQVQRAAACSSRPGFPLHHAGTRGRGVFLPVRLLRNQRQLMQIPGPLSHQRRARRGGCAPDHRKRAEKRRKVLNEMESKALLSAFHIPVAKTMIARSPTKPC